MKIFKQVEFPGTVLPEHRFFLGLQIMALILACNYLWTSFGHLAQASEVSELRLSVKNSLEMTGEKEVYSLIAGAEKDLLEVVKLRNKIKSQCYSHKPSRDELEAILKKLGKYPTNGDARSALYKSYIDK